MELFFRGKGTRERCGIPLGLFRQWGGVWSATNEYKVPIKWPVSNGECLGKTPLARLIAWPRGTIPLNCAQSGGGAWRRPGQAVHGVVHGISPNLTGLIATQSAAMTKLRETAGQLSHDFRSLSAIHPVWLPPPSSSTFRTIFWKIKSSFPVIFAQWRKWRKIPCPYWNKHRSESFFYLFKISYNLQKF